MNSGKFYAKGGIAENYLPATQPGQRKPRILVAPLDWGLGHATRCIPVIYQLLELGCDVWLAGEGAQQALLQQEFPALTCLELPGYRIKYGRSAIGLLWNIFGQSYKLLRAIRLEHEWLKDAVDKYSFDGIISDNRYGLYHQTVPSVFITHQLRIGTPLGKWSERLLQKKNYAYINRFTECWVPDDPGENNLAGELSRPEKKPAIRLRYIGLLSRFEKMDAGNIPDPVEPNRPGADRLLIVLSGPEPQRTILEKKVIRDIARYPGTAVIVRGLPGSLRLVPSTNSIRFFNHLSAAELSREMNRADYIISRSGYSTIMDLVKLKKKSILIPTPGQTEQEYLAGRLQDKNIAVTVSQKSFSLFRSLQAAKAFQYAIPEMENRNNLLPAVHEFIHAISKD